MSKKQEKEHDHDDYDGDFYETELYADYDIVFKGTKTTTKQHKAKSKKNARHRVEDYLERKALKEKVNYWNNYFNL